MGAEASSPKKEPRDAAPAKPYRLATAIAGVFALYVAHDALQERAFRTKGFTFGWFMTLVEIVVVSVCAAALEWGTPPDENMAADDLKTVHRCVAALAFCLATSQGTGSAALNYVHYPVKVAFKSSKLVPTMLFGIVLTRKKFSGLEYAAALLMCAALAGLSLADYRASSTAEANNQPLGCALLTAAVFADALVPNLQEKCLKELKYPVGRMIVYSNTGCALLVFAYCWSTGELARAVPWCLAHHEASALLFLQACCSYLGLRAYLVVVKDLSGVAGVVTTSLRKVLTLALSFVLFEKPFTSGHLAAFMLLAGGVALATYARYVK
mmetsp:Transcript_27281/g.82258  ORF Transcript_27281/g.82258 Transcript_27281/m.82258 type:complete len:325 (-) Transcript_27281:18-992(-)